MSREGEPRSEPGTEESGGPGGEPPWAGWNWEDERRRLRVLCWRYQVPMEASEDLVHDAVARLIVAWEAGKVSDAGAYLWGTLDRLCRTYDRTARERRKRGIVVVPLDEALFDLSGPDPRPGLEARLELAHVAAALPAWARRSLEAVALGYTSEEAAAHVGVAPGSVRVYRQRTRALVRKRLYGYTKNRKQRKQHS